MPYQGQRYLPPISTPITSRYQTDYIKQDGAPPKSYKGRTVTNLPPINYSQCRQKIGDTSYEESFKGKFGPAAPTAKPPPYDFPSKDRFATSTYRANFRKTTTLQLPLLPTSPTRRNNPHPPAMANACFFPQRGYWIWPHLLNPMFTETKDEDGLPNPAGYAYERRRGPFDTWEEQLD